MNVSINRVEIKDLDELPVRITSWVLNQSNLELLRKTFTGTLFLIRILLDSSEFIASFSMKGASYA